MSQPTFNKDQFQAALTRHKDQFQAALTRRVSGSVSVYCRRPT
ncbi:hypothetical protein SeGA_4750 [Salmonella enterica subsp. enterica serovar Gaminara str. A4-567]|nr:hypothetical protein SeGA_4750 [Salmonella enterica subsp. enterica serovar Gaminara str. A4-567]